MSIIQKTGMRYILSLVCIILFIGCSKKELPIYNEDKMAITQIKMPDKIVLGNTIAIEVELQNTIQSLGFKRFDISLTDEYNINIKAINIEPINTVQSQYSNEKIIKKFVFSPQKPGTHFLHFISKENKVITKIILVQ